MIHTSDNSLLYVAVPKTGCTTLKTVIAAAAGIIQRDSSRYRLSDGTIHKSWLDGMECWSELARPARSAMLFERGTTRVTSVRNPFERAVSCYLDKIATAGERSGLGRAFLATGRRSFRAFLEFLRDTPSARADVHACPMAELNFARDVKYDLVVRHETFLRDAAKLMEVLGFVGADIPMPRFPTHAARKVAELIGKKEVALILEIYDADFEAFGYPTVPPA